MSTLGMFSMLGGYLECCGVFSTVGGIIFCYMSTSTVLSTPKCSEYKFYRVVTFNFQNFIHQNKAMFISIVNNLLYTQVGHSIAENTGRGGLMVRGLGF